MWQCLLPLCVWLLTAHTVHALSKYDEYILAPHSRTLTPTIITTSPTGATGAGTTVTLCGNASYAVFDFGLEVGGWISLTMGASTPTTASATQRLQLAFSESPLFTTRLFPDNSQTKGLDSSISVPYKKGAYTMPSALLRGGFRYLTVWLNTTATGNSCLSFSSVSLAYAPMPHLSGVQLREYSGWFHSSDELLNKIWYAGAYTVQTNVVGLNTGRQPAGPAVPAGMPWANNASLSGTTLIDSTTPAITLVDGAKRDRWVWPGDMGVAVHTAFVSQSLNLPAVKNALAIMFHYQLPTGEIPECGPPALQRTSETYHMWTLYGLYTYHLYTADTAFLTSIWPAYKLAMAYLTARLDTTGLASFTGTRDWARLSVGGRNSEANMLLYQTLLHASTLAGYMSDAPLAASWNASAASLRTAINTRLWDSGVGMYRDNDTGVALYPQDANSLALWFGVPPGPVEADRITTGLLKNWNAIGPVTPELPDAISPFTSSFELFGRLATGGDNANALELTRRLWRNLLTRPDSTGGSTFLEGITANGSLAYRWNRGYTNNNDGSYTSHAHGWSTGPTSALSFYVMGIRLLAPGGATWRFEPHVGDLSAVDGGFATPLGVFSASWTVSQSGGVGWELFSAPVGTPAGTVGSVGVRCLAGWGAVRLLVDEVEVGWTDCEAGGGVVEAGEIQGGARNVCVVGVYLL